MRVKDNVELERLHTNSYMYYITNRVIPQESPAITLSVKCSNEKKKTPTLLTEINS